MSQPSANSYFPFTQDIINQCLERTYTLTDTFDSAIRCFLLTRPLSRRGNPIGSKIYSLIHKLIPDSELPNYESDLQNELTEQFPELSFETVSLVRNVNDLQMNQLILSIQYSSPFTELTDLQFIIAN